MEITKEEWDRRVKVLQNFFIGKMLPKEKIQLSGAEVLVDAEAMVCSDLYEISKGYNMTFYPAMMRLRALMKYLQK